MPTGAAVLTNSCGVGGDVDAPAGPPNDGAAAKNGAKTSSGVESRDAPNEQRADQPERQLTLAVWVVHCLSQRPAGHPPPDSVGESLMMRAPALPNALLWESTGGTLRALHLRARALVNPWHP